MFKRKIIMMILAASIAATQVGCFSKDNKNIDNTNAIVSNETGEENQTNSEIKGDDEDKDNQDNQDNNENTINDKDAEEKVIVDEFYALIDKKDTIPGLVAFIDKNIPSLSPENASLLIIGWEKAQNDYLDILEDNINNNDAIGRNIETEMGKGLDVSKAESTEDPDLKKILIEMRDSGYKFETVEGYFFPVIDYERYKKYSQYVTEELKEYINIMATESNNVPAKDAGLLISWDEIITRALSQENFINKYKDSHGIEEIKWSYDRYVYFAIKGTDNTPLFSYSDKTMVSEAKESYLAAIKNAGDSEFLKMISDYINVLKDNEYKLTKDVEEYQNSIVKIE